MKKDYEKWNKLLLDMLVMELNMLKCNDEAMKFGELEKAKDLLKKCKLHFTSIRNQ